MVELLHSVKTASRVISASVLVLGALSGAASAATNGASNAETLSQVNGAASQAHKEAATGSVLPFVQKDSQADLDLGQGNHVNLDGNVDADGLTKQGDNDSIVAQKLTSDAIRMSKVFHNAESRDFTVRVSNAGQIEQTKSGGLLIHDGGGKVNEVVDQPWARDANGREVSTHYEVDGNKVTQIVDFDQNTAFPVVSDPTFRRWAHVIPEIDFNRDETRQVRNPAAVAGMVGAVCAAAGPETAGFACGTAAAGSGAVAAVASNAYGDGRCLAIRPPFVPVEIDCAQ